MTPCRVESLRLQMGSWEKLAISYFVLLNLFIYKFTLQISFYTIRRNFMCYYFETWLGVIFKWSVYVLFQSFSLSPALLAPQHSRVTLTRCNRWSRETKRDRVKQTFIKYECTRLTVNNVFFFLFIYCSHVSWSMKFKCYSSPKWSNLESKHVGWSRLGVAQIHNVHLGSFAQEPLS